MNQVNQDKAIITREAAKAQGLKRYFTGEQCRNGHTGERYVTTGQCVECCKGRSVRHQQRKQGIKTDKQPAILKIISRADAQAQGLKRFYVEEECKHGHMSERYTRDGACVECNHIRARDHHSRNPHHASTTFTAEAYPKAIIPLTQDEQDALANVYRRAQRLTQWSGIKHQVDHCYPLALGGVHHPENLTVLPRSLNRAKSNEADPTIPSVLHGGLVSFSFMVKGQGVKQGRAPLMIRQV